MQPPSTQHKDSPGRNQPEPGPRSRPAAAASSIRTHPGRTKTELRPNTCQAARLPIHNCLL
eukprot:364208-Chlamydomonas_euryale.AAC.30